MGLFSIDVLCETCNEKNPQLVERADADKDHVCELCGGVAKRVMSAPNPTRKSFVDGVKREGFDTLKKVAKLEKKMYDLPPNKRGEFKKEIKEIQKIKK